MPQVGSSAKRRHGDLLGTDSRISVGFGCYGCAMSVLDVFSKRGKPPADVYVYDQLPPKLRAQLVHLLRDLSDPNIIGIEQVWMSIAKSIAREHGLLDLPETPSHRFEGRDYGVDCLNYVFKAEAGHALDLVELVFRFMQTTDDYRIRRH